MSNSFEAAEAFSAVSESAGLPDWLKRLRAEALTEFNQQAWPTRKTEAWKYTPLKSLYENRWKKPLAVSDAPSVDIEAWEAAKIRIVNGQLQQIDALPAGVTLVKLTECGVEAGTEFLQRTNQLSSEFFFDALNQSSLDQGYWLRVEPNIQVKQPIHISFVADGDEVMVNTRVLIDVEAGASLTVAETFEQTTGSAALVNANSILSVAENAQLTHYHLLLEEGNNHHLGQVSAELNRASKLSSYHMAIGGILKRKNIAVTHNGEGAELTLNGVYLPTGTEIIDYHTSIDHAVPHCTSEQNFRGIIGDKGRAVFNGRIHIHQYAQKSLAEMNNRNLLLSPEAQIDTKPELEIYADDVRCAHGATIAQLDDNMLFYFLSRGISRSEAEVMLSFGFINELLDALPDEPVRLLLQPKLSELFAGDRTELARHIS